MKIEDAIEKMKIYQKYANRDMYDSRIYLNPESAEEEIDACNVAIKALEKQIPKKPIEKESGWYYCPTCDTKVPASANYCCGYYNDKQGCGQALKW